MANDQINAVTGLNTVEVSLVDRGANRKRFAFFKSEEKMAGMEEMFKVILDTEVANESKFEEIFKQDEMDDETKEAARAALRLLTAFKDKLPEDVVEKLAKAADYPMPEKKQAEETEETEEEKAERLAKQAEDEEGEKLAKQKEEEEAMMKSGNLPILKDGSPDLSSVPVAVRPVIQALWKQGAEDRALLKAANAAVAVERDLREVKEHTEKAAAEYGSVGSPAEIGKIMKSLGDLDPKIAESMGAILKSANAVIDKSNMFAQLGSGRVPDESSAEARLEELTNNYMQKNAASKMTHAQAYNAVLKSAEGKRLYAEYNEEQKTQH